MLRAGLGCILGSSAYANRMMYVPFRVASSPQCIGIFALCQSSQFSGDPPAVASEEETKASKCAVLRATDCADHPCFTHLNQTLFPRICARKPAANLSCGEWQTSVPGSDPDKLKPCNLEEGLGSSLLSDTPLSCCTLLGAWFQLTAVTVQMKNRWFRLLLSGAGTEVLWCALLTLPQSETSFWSCQETVGEEG